MRLSYTLIIALLVGASTSGAVFAHGGGWGGGGGGWNRGGRVGIYFGAPIGFNFGYSPYSYYGAPSYGSPYYSPAPVFYPPVQPAPVIYTPVQPAPVIYTSVQPAPVIYTNRRDDPQLRIQEAPRNSSQNVHASLWYYCVASNAYYPYVNKCPGGWLRVAPDPEIDK